MLKRCDFKKLNDDKQQDIINCLKLELKEKVSSNALNNFEDFLKCILDAHVLYEFIYDGVKFPHEFEKTYKIKDDKIEEFDMIKYINRHSKFDEKDSIIFNKSLKEFINNNNKI